MDTKPPTLYSYIQCPFAMRARMALIVSDIQCELREINLKNKPDRLLSTSPKATVPVLALESGVVLDESYDVMRYALGVCDPDDWLKCTGASEFIEKADKAFFAAFRRYKTPEGYPGESWKTPFELFLSVLETALYQNDGVLDENKKFTIKDAAVLPLVYRMSILDESWWQSLPFPKTKTWLSQFIGSRLFRNTMAEHPVWREDSDADEEWLLAS